MEQHTCKLCHERPAGAESHIIPRALFRDIDSAPGDALRSIPRDPAEREKTQRTGPYDSTILCHDCEACFQRYDDCGVKALRLEPVPNPRWGNDRVGELPGVDAGKLKLFFMHVLWRAHESGRNEWRAVDLGPRADALRALLLKDDPGPVSDFGVLLILYLPDPDGAHRFISAATPGRWPDGARLYRFHIQRWVPAITTASVGMPAELTEFALTPGEPVPVVAAGKPFREGCEMQDAQRLLRGRRE